MGWEATGYVCQVSLGLSIHIDLIFHNFFLSSTFPHRFSKSPTVFHSGRQSEGFSKVGAGVGGIVCVSGLSEVRCWEEWLWYILLTLPFRKFLPYGPLLPSNSLPSFCHCPLFPYFCVCVSSFPQGGSPPSQVTLEQIPQRRAIPTNIPTMSLWSVTSLLILRGQSSIMWRMIPCLRAVGTQVGSYTVDAACLIQFLHRDSPREKKLGQVRNVSHGKGERHRTWVIDWDEKKQNNSE